MERKYKIKGWKNEKLIPLIIIISIIMLPNLSNVKAEINNDVNEKDLLTLLESESTVILTGIVKSIESSWVNTTESNLIYSFADVAVIEYEKFSDTKQTNVKLAYVGGAVGEIGSLVISNPWGELICYPNQKIRIYCRSSDKFEGFLSPIRIERLDAPKDSELGTLSFSSSEYIYEEQKCFFEFIGYYWETSDFPIGYHINNNTGDCDGEYNAVLASFNTWESDSRSTIDYTCLGRTGKNAFSRDNDNILFWRGAGYITDLATTHYWFNVLTRKLLEFDICFNDDVTWCIGKQSGKYDVQNAATHEVGHTLKLEDLYDSSSSLMTMYWFGSTNEILKRDLYVGDQDGVRYIYPSTVKPTVSITNPLDGQTVSRVVTITATVTSGYSISEVKYKATSYGTFTYDSGWVSMTLSGGSYTGTWDATYRTGYHYITVRAKTNQNIYGYDWIVVNVAGT